MGVLTPLCDKGTTTNTRFARASCQREIAAKTRHAAKSLNEWLRVRQDRSRNKNHSGTPYYRTMRIARCIKVLSENLGKQTKLEPLLFRRRRASRKMPADDKAALALTHHLQIGSQTTGAVQRTLHRQHRSVVLDELVRDVVGHAEDLFLLVAHVQIALDHASRPGRRTIS